MKRLKKSLLFSILAILAYSIWQLWDISRVGHQDEGSSADCAIVLGAAAWHDKPSPVLRERLNHAIELYQKGRVSALLLTGGYGKGADFSESEVAQDYCVKNGVPERAIRIESDSKTTLENLREAKKILEAERWNSALLVSDPWHLKRARTMARNLEISAEPSATQTSRFQSLKAKSTFLLGEFFLLHQYFISGK